MLAGRYPGEEFAGLRPRIVWDRVAGVIHGRPGAQRLAVTSGGTIPDRGLLRRVPAGRRRTPRRRAGSASSTRRWCTSRGSATCSCSAPRSWRIEDITPDRVLVLPAPGQPGKLPFWHGDTPGRPAELGKAIGAKLRELAALARRRRPSRRCSASGLDPLAARNLVSLPRRPAAGHRARARRQDAGRRAVPRRARRLAGRAALPLRRPGARAVGAGHHGAAARAVRRDGRAGAAHRRRDHHPGARHRRAAARRDRAARPGGDRRHHHRRGRRLARCSPPGSASAPPGRCCCRGGSRAGGRRCGSSGSGARSCSRSPRSSPASRSRWRPSGSACRTCSTCPR